MALNMDILGNRAPGPELYPCGSFGLSATTKSSGTIKAPKARVEYFILSARYTVTDASIAAGQNFFGAMTRFSLGDKAGQKIVQVESNEMQDLTMFTCGPATGRYLDADPVTATETYAYAVVKGPFQLSAMIDPEFFIEVNPVGEWDSATDFNAEISVQCVLSSLPIGPGVYIDRQYFPTSTKHTVLGLGAGQVQAMWLKNGTSGYNTSRIEIDYGDSKTKLDIMRPYENVFAAAALTQATNTTRLFLEDLDIPVTPRRNVVVNNSTTDTLLVLTRSLVGA